MHLAYIEDQTVTSLAQYDNYQLNLRNCLLSGVDFRPLTKRKISLSVEDCIFRNVKWPSADEALHLFEFGMLPNDVTFQAMLYDLYELTNKPMKLETAVKRFEEWVRRGTPWQLGKCPTRDCLGLRIQFHENARVWMKRFDPTKNEVPPKPAANELLAAALESGGNSGFKTYWKRHK